MRFPVRRPAGRLCLLLLCLGLFACAGARPPPPPGPERAPELSLRPVSFDQLQGWERDRPGEALEAFRRSCGALMQKPDDREVGPQPIFGRFGDWRPACV
ncbi:MAG: murein transglycosylase, partial [Geminicoccales bacterium]